MIEPIIDSTQSEQKMDTTTTGLALLREAFKTAQLLDLHEGLDRAVPLDLAVEAVVGQGFILDSEFPQYDWDTQEEV